MNFINIFSLRERAREFGVAICTAALRSLCADLREIEVPGKLLSFFSLLICSLFPPLSFPPIFLDRFAPARVEYGI